MTEVPPENFGEQIAASGGLPAHLERRIDAVCGSAIREATDDPDRTMTPRPILWAAIVAGAVILAIVALLASGSFRPTGSARVPGQMHSQAAAFSHEWTDAWQHNGRHATPAVHPVSGPSSIVAAPSGGVGTALLGGNISWAEPELGIDYLATRFPVGTLVRVCGTVSGRCWTTRTNDYGPSKRIKPPRIADLAVLEWERLCGLPRSAGVCAGTVETVERIALPATDAESP